MLWPRLLLLCIWLTGCGGGLWIGIGDDGFDDPPSVNLTTSAGAAGSGDTIRLAAAASDDFGVDHVSFFRIESNGTATLLSTDGTAPFQVDTVIPVTSDAVVEYFARAVDEIGQASDSARVSVTVLR